METKKVKNLLEERNSIDAEIASIEKNITESNSVILIKEILNLHHGVGEFRSGDYYAPDRLYSGIPGVKNLRDLRKVSKDSDFHTGGYGWVEKEKINFDYGIVIKVNSPSGYLLPDVITVPKLGTVKVFFDCSKNMVNAIDY